VLGAANGHPWLGAAFALFLLAIHLVLCRERRTEIFTVLCIATAGTLVDNIQAYLGVFVFLSGYYTQWLVPFWITVMWLQFATLFHFALSWLSGRYLLSAVFGAFGGPLAFLTGERLGAAIFPYGYRYSLSILLVVWFLVLPGCVYIADRFTPARKGYRFEKNSD
jgi:hypothetical protein